MNAHGSAALGIFVGLLLSLIVVVLFVAVWRSPELLIALAALGLLWRIYQKAKAWDQEHGLG